MDSRDGGDGEAISNGNLVVIDGFICSSGIQGQGFGTLFNKPWNKLLFNKIAPRVFIWSWDELLSYFEMNEFIRQGIVDLGVGNEVDFLMCWKNPFYQEELYDYSTS